MSGTGEDETREYIMSYYLVSDHPSRSTTGTPQGTVVADGELAAIRQALGDLIQEVRRRGAPPSHRGKDRSSPGHDRARHYREESVTSRPLRAY